MGRKTSKAGVELIKSFEGCRLTSYLCPASRWTIGYGRASGDVRQGQKISQEQAEAYLLEDLAKFEAGVNALVRVPITQGMFDALVSFSYNLGLRALENSTLLKLLNQRKYGEAGVELNRWIHVSGAVLPGLVRRRKAEQALFDTPGPRKMNA